MPKCDGAYLLGYLFDLGIRTGEYSVTWAEIESWQRQTGIELEPWETQFVKRLSELYVNESHAARDPDARAPFAVSQPVLPAQSGALMAYIRGMK